MSRSTHDRTDGGPASDGGSDAASSAPDAVILIAGPTASGKSELALDIARAINGAIINCDSMQVYRELRVLTARPSEADEAKVPHLLYGHVSAADAYSVGRYAEDAARALREAKVAGCVPILTGGTGLYFAALTEGLSPVPPVPDEVRAEWRVFASGRSAQDLYAELTARDPEMADRLGPTDRQRIMRAIEVIVATGTSLAEWQRRPRSPVLRAGSALKKVVVMRDRDELYRRSDERFARMVAGGAVEEVRDLVAQNLDPNLPAMRALGVAPIAEWIAGKSSRDRAICLGQTASRQYIKRQLTWLNRNMISWKTINLSDNFTNRREFLSKVSTWVDRMTGSA